MNKKVFALVAVFLLIGTVSVSRASGDVFAEANRTETLYGQGVHAFYGNDYQGAIDLLGEVEKLKSEDPRPYFFLGLAHGRLGQDDKAIKYLEKAAGLEWSGRAGRDYKISDTLRRIQGFERLTVEKYRAKARVESQNEEKRKQDVKFGTEKKKDREIVAKMAKPPVATAPFGASSVNPFAASGEAAASPEADAPVKKKPVAEPVKKAEEDDPFGTSDEKKEKAEEKKPEPKPEPKKAEPADDDDDDPFQ